MNRTTWPVYFMGIAEHVATRATCDRKHVGAVIVKGKEILATGYNGSMPGAPHCDDAGHLMIAGHCVRTVHAEINAIAQAAKHGCQISGADIYVTAHPCWNCFKVIVNSGIKNIFYKEEYRHDTNIDEALKYVDVTITRVNMEKSNGKKETT